MAVSIAICTGCGTTANNYAYATLPASNQIAIFREDPNSGVLTQLSGSPIPAGDGASSLVIHPSGKFLYAANPGQNENDISLFDINTDGTLTEVFPRTTVTPNASLPKTLVMDPSGSFLYVANTGSNNISIFSIAAGTGALTQLANSPVAINLSPLNMLLSPSGSFLFVSANNAALQPTGVIEVFGVASGVLTPLGYFPTAGTNPDGMAIDPTGTYLYAANYGSNSISILSIGSTGVLTPVQGSPISDIYTSPISLTLDPKGQFLYVANQTNNNVASYSISSSTGLPTILNVSTLSNTSQSTGAFGTESSPSLVVGDPSGKYLFVGNQGSSAGIQSFSLSSGTLTEIFTYNVGNTPSSIAILQMK
jgi:6-phosphogluconolactonase (cycloisomerase 2 family)